MLSRKQQSAEVHPSPQTDSVVKYSEFSQKLSLRTKIFYSFGHAYNDLCASIWFSYTLLYFKLSFNDTTAGLLLLLGQVADAISTPLIGYGSDKNLAIFGNYGRRKVWHLLGSILVTCSFPLIFSSCVLCSDSTLLEKFAYYSIFIILFQIGWASVQVAHLSLITDLTDISSERVELNAYRQAATVASSICVYTITLLLLGVEDSTISKNDAIVFMKVVHLITLIGIIFSVLFHIFVKEPNCRNEWELKHIEEKADKCDSEGKMVTLLEQGLHKSDVDISHSVNQVGQAKELTRGKFLRRDRSKRIWSDWLTSVSFWKICLIYMMSRLYVNVTQVYTPLYLQETLLLAKRNIAIVPFITYTAGFIFSLLSKSKSINAKTIMCLGCFFSFVSCVWIWYCYLQISIWEVFVMAAVFGIGGTFMLIGSLSLTSDLINDNKISGAFVYGLMSFFDKLINGGVIALVQHLKPASSSTPASANDQGVTSGSLNWNNTWTVPQNGSSSVEAISLVEPTVFYLYVLVFVSGAAVIVTFFALILIMRKDAQKVWHSVKHCFFKKHEIN